MRKKLRRAESPAVSTVIITTALLVILGTASSFSLDMLEIQMQNSEFEQAKTALLLLDKVINDVSLRPGAASSLQLSQRSGGIGLYETGGIEVKIFDGSSILWENRAGPYKNSVTIMFRGGSKVSTTNITLTGTDKLIVDSFASLGRVRLIAQDGAWIVLDYNRVRVSFNQELGIMDVFLINLERGQTYGSGTVIVKVHNKGAKVSLIQLDTPSDNICVYVKADGKETYYPSSTLEYQVRTVRIIEVTIEISIIGG